jgi:alkanesulfonate monooxygenase
MASREGLGGYLADRHWMARVLAETHARMDELARVQRFDEFALSGHPHMEEAYWFGENVLPRLAAQGLWTRTRRTDPAAQSAPQVPFAGSRTQR